MAKALKACEHSKAFVHYTMIIAGNPTHNPYAEVWKPDVYGFGFVTKRFPERGVIRKLPQVVVCNPEEVTA